MISTIQAMTITLPGLIQPIVVTGSGPSRLRVRLFQGKLNIRRLMRVRPQFVQTIAVEGRVDHFKKALVRHKRESRAPATLDRWPKPRRASKTGVFEISQLVGARV